MSTGMQIPAHIMNSQAPRRNLASSIRTVLGGNNPPHISIQGNRFHLVDASGATRDIETFHLDVVIIDLNPVKCKTFYEKPWDPAADTFQPPDCFSDNGIAPSTQAQNPQNLTCAGCPMAAWGSEVSKVSGKGVPRCKDVVKLACIVPGDPSQMVYLLRMPPATLKHFRVYTQRIEAFMRSGAPGAENVDFQQLITRLTFENQSVGILNFQEVAWIDDASAALRDKAYASGITDQLVGKTDQPITVLPPAAAQRAIAAPAAAPPPYQPAGQLPPPVAPQTQPVAAPAFLQQAPSFTPAAPVGQPYPSNPPQPFAQQPAPYSQPAPALPVMAPAPVAPEAPAPKKRGPKKKAAAEPAFQLSPPAPAPAGLAAAPAFAQPSPVYQPPSNGDFAAAPGAASLQPAPDPLDIPAFLRRGDTPAAPAPQAPAPTFGVQAGAPAPPADLEQKLAAAFSLPTS